MRIILLITLFVFLTVCKTMMPKASHVKTEDEHTGIERSVKLENWKVNELLDRGVIPQDKDSYQAIFECSFDWYSQLNSKNFQSPNCIENGNSEIGSTKSHYLLYQIIEHIPYHQSNISINLSCNRSTDSSKVDIDGNTRLLCGVTFNEAQLTVQGAITTTSEVSSTLVGDFNSGNTFDFDIDEGTVSFLLETKPANGPEMGDMYVVTRLEDPHGRVIVSDSLPPYSNSDSLTSHTFSSVAVSPSSMLSINRSVYGPFTGSGNLLVPNSPLVYPGQTYVPSGKWRAEVSVFGRVIEGQVYIWEKKEKEVNITLVQKTSKNHPAKGCLKLNLYFDSQEAQNNSVFMDDVEWRLKEKFAKINIEVKFAHSLLSQKAKDAISEGIMYQGYPLPIHQVIAFNVLPQITDIDGVNVVVLKSHNDQFPNNILAFSTGMPGAFINRGDSSGGLILAIENHESHKIALNLAHELGHHLGLFHEIELGFLSFVSDPLPDTDGYGIMAGAATNIKSTFTQDQGFVIRRHPHVALEGSELYNELGCGKNDL